MTKPGSRLVTAHGLVTLVRSQRERAGLSQLALAERVGVSRQALIAIEAGRQVPSTGLALQLARALGCGVEELFKLEGEAGISAAVAPQRPGVRHPAQPAGERVALGRVAGRWVAHRIAGDCNAAADGLLLRETPGGRGVVEPLLPLAALERNVLVAGCAPLLGVLTQRAGLCHRDTRASWLRENSRRALELLRSGLVHVAGVHLFGAGARQDNLPAIRRRFGGRRMLVVNLTRWRQGLVVPPGNPRGLRDAGDLLRRGLRFARRDEGAGADQLARRLLTAAAGRDAALPAGPSAAGHEAVAQLVAAGAADAGIAIEGAALAFGLDFVPLSEERFDLVLPAESAALPPVSRLIELVGDKAFREEMARLPGYDASLSGQVTTLDA